MAPKLPYILLVLLIGTNNLLISQCCFSQAVNRNIPGFDSLEQLHTTGKLNDTTFLKKAIDLIDQNLPNPYLINNTMYTKKIALKKNAYYEYRYLFFIRLSKNALYNNQEGSSVFYAEKMEEAAKERAGYIPTLFSACLEIGKRERWKQNTEGIEKTTSVLPFIETLPRLIKQKTIPELTIFCAQYILKYTQSMYLQLNDTLEGLKMQNLSKNIYNTVLQRLGNGYTESFAGSLYSDCLFMQYKKALYFNDQPSIQKILNAIYFQAEDASKKNFNWASDQKMGASIFLANFFLQNNKLDSAEKYLTIITGKVNFRDLAYNEQMLKMYAELEKRKGNYEKAYHYIERSAIVTDSITNSKKMDIASNDYAQTEAEYNRNELEIAAEEKTKHNWLIATLITVLTASSIHFAYINKRRRKKANANVKKLNFESQLQIARLEEQNRIAKQEERKRLGMDLHDSLAGTLAAIKVQLETVMLKNKEFHDEPGLINIYNNILSAYKSTRQKSHDWFDNNEEVNNILFSERITTLFDRGLPVGKYEKEIWIDNESTKSLTLDEKIEYVYIINEAIANILKHSKASKVSLSLYEEVSNEIILLIKDDGIGFNMEKAKTGVGLNSLNERVRKIGGRMNIISNKNGTEIIISKPVTVSDKL